VIPIESLPMAAAAAMGAAPSLVLRRKLAAARLDPETGLPTRYSWTMRAERMVRRRRDTLVLMIDLNRLKEINDTHGHAAGDVLLRVQAKRLALWSREAGAVAGRLHGDEFAVAVRLAERDIKFQLDQLGLYLSRPVMLAGRRISAPAAIGVASAQKPTLRQIQHAADIAMYAAKRSYKHIETPEDIAANRERGTWWQRANAADFEHEVEDAPEYRVREHGPNGDAVFDLVERGIVSQLKYDADEREGTGDDES